MSDSNDDKLPGNPQSDLVERSTELRKSYDFLNMVIENIPAMMAVKDATELRFVLLNRHGEELTGIERSESLGKNDYDFFPKEQAEHFIARDREVLESGQLLVIPEEPIQTRNKGMRLLRTLKMPVPDENGRPKYLLAMSEDITERKHAEAKLQASEAMFRGLLAASPDAVLVVGETGIIRLASERVRAMFGYDPAELIGLNARTLIAGPKLDEAVIRLRNALVEGTGAIVPGLEGVRKDGTRFPMEASLSQQTSESTQRIIVAIRDVTERVAVETQLRQSQKMEAIGNLTGGLAHDFNNLLSVIIGNIDLLRERLADDPEAGELADEALSAALRGADLTRRLLAFARRQPLQPRAIDVNDTVVSISKLLRRTLAEDIEIEHRLGSGVWPVIADPVQLEACLVNIVTNARDAMPNGGKLQITTANRHLDADYVSLYPELAPGDYALIEMTDTGTGIVPEAVSQIFEPFFTTKPEGKGTGLGLSMVFGFMKQSGGHINVYSEVGVGTTFRLYLPRTETNSAMTEQPAAATPARHGRQETVLAVEDNPGLRGVVVRQLTQLGYRCLEAEDGPSALKILESQPVDLLFTDVIMPGGMSGYDLGRIARTRWPEIKVLLTSGFPEEKLNGNGTAPWNMRLLLKPYRKEDLARALRQVFDE